MCLCVCTSEASPPSTPLTLSQCGTHLPPRLLGLQWPCPARQALLPVGHRGFLKRRWDHSPRSISPPSVPELPHRSAHPQGDTVRTGRKSPRINTQTGGAASRGSAVTQGGNVCTDKPDSEGTECKMRMHWKIKPETPAGSVAAAGCTPRPLGGTCSPSFALRETSRERLEKNCLQQEGSVFISASARAA